MSILMDSCNVMRGSKSGLEVRIRREKAPHLLDIDGDSCHHVHNATKAFCKPFGYVVESLFNDLHNDLKWSADLRDFMQEICVILGVKYTAPLRFVNHRWLSVYTVAVDTLRLMDVYSVFYAGFITPDKKPKVFPIVQEIYRRIGVSDAAKERVREIHLSLSKKSLTKDGRDRKDRILGKIFDERMLIKLVLNLYSSVLPLLKNFTLLFEMKEPLVHILHDKQLELIREFLDCFIKPEKLQNITASRLAKLDLHSKDMHLKPVHMFMGVNALRTVKENIKSYIVRSFLENLESAYVASGHVLKTKLPIGNSLLQSLSAIDPCARGHSLTLQYLQNLALKVDNVLSEEEKNQYERELRRYQRDEKLPEFENMRIDTWWADVQMKGQYPVLSKMVLSLLTCFHGPQVEGSFSMMGDIMDPKSSRMKIETYSAIQTVKSTLQAQKKTAVEYFSPHDFQNNAPQRRLLNNMRSAYKSYKCEKEKAKEQEEQRKRELEVRKANVETKRKASEQSERASKIARLAHKQLMMKS
ncbi:uncharacterized protein LOC132563943 [Ylistrum balloti]|nr:uncharacterized protein LOC132563943 [Ylistrum balloti]